MRYLLLVSYDGTAFSGWQIQPGRRTVQGELLSAAQEIFDGDVLLTGSGRTDAGVHAEGQIAQLDAPEGPPAERLFACFNRLLPPDVKVRASARAPEGFDCTRSAKRKTYRYRGYYARTELPLLDRYAARLSKPPDAARMREAARLLLGEHDFSAFRASGYTSKTSVRTIERATVIETAEGGARCFSVEVTGNGFLYNMVRILAGELFAVGCGKEEGFTRAFETGERSALAKTMPARGLTLMSVDYGADLFGAKE